MHWKKNWGTRMWLNVLMLIGVMLIGGALVVVVGAMLIAAIDFLQNGDSR
jgi:polyferredoxin